MEINQLYVRNWDFSLYKIEDKYIINVTFPMGITDYSRDFYLNKDDLSYLGDYELLKELSEKIRNNYKAYKNQEVDTETSRFLALWISEHPRFR